MYNWYYNSGIVYPLTLATSSDLATWTGTDAPANATAILRSCTTLVLEATKNSLYEVDDTGIATDPILAQAMNDATCIQAAAWVKLGIDPLAGGIDLGGVKRSKKIGSASFEIAGAEQTAAAKAFAVNNLVPEAEKKLRQQRLLTNKPRSR